MILTITDVQLQRACRDRRRDLEASQRAFTTEAMCLIRGLVAEYTEVRGQSVNTIHHDKRQEFLDRLANLELLK